MLTNPLLRCWMLTCIAGLSVQAAAAATLKRTDDAVSVEFPDARVTLTFALHDGLLLGLHQASVDGVTLKSDATVQRPVLAQEWAGDRMIWPLMRFKDAIVTGNRVEILAELLGTTDERAYRATFVFDGNRGRALAEGMTPELETLKTRRDAAVALLENAYAQNEEHRQLAERLAAARADLDTAATELERIQLQGPARNVERRLNQLRSRLRPELLEKSPELRAAEADIEAFNAALEERAMGFGDIHRDFYRFALLQQPEQICDVGFLKKLAAELKDKLQPAGTITWVIEPDTRNIAGWPWRGWKQHYRFQLAGERKVNVLHQLGTWELDGNAVGSTVVNLRYRGLGRIEQPLTPGATPGTINEAFTTTEIIPGAAGGQYLVSPQIPSSETNDLTDRGYGLRHRVGAWIGYMARGAGHGFVDFQYRPHAALAAFHQRQGNLRAMTEAFPGDRCLSQTDQEFFALTGHHTTEPQVYLMLAAAVTGADGDNAGPDFWRTRWKELDQYVRDMVSAELGFVQHEVLPGIGLLFDGGWAAAYRRMAERDVDAWADQGVRLIAVHNPGWISGRYQGPEGPPKTYGGVCDIYDWVPTRDMQQPWKAFTRACARRDVVYFPWLGQTQPKHAPFAERVGHDPRYWALNAPGDDGGAGYGAHTMKGNILHPRFRDEFVRTLQQTWREYGYQGFWGDSFQNLFMSQLDWANGTGNSMQRAWWEQIAAWTRQGIAWMAESHSFPGMSCSIEVSGWQQDHWYFTHVWKWYRGVSQRNYTSEQLDRTLFRVMANKGWTAPDGSPSVIPGFKRMAHEYLAALPGMRRPYVLGEQRGMLWLGYDDDKTGVWFSFAEQSVPPGVTASYILGDNAAPLTAAKADHTYRVAGDDLLQRFGLSRGPQPDPRLGRKYEPPGYAWPDWAKERTQDGQ
jgi:hypothetical protein